MGRYLFIRDDDVWTLDKSFLTFFNLLIDRQLPVVYAVIPGKMDNELIRFLRQAKDKNPRSLDIVQHGWIHANHSLQLGIKYEFGASRSVKFQREDIQQGFKKMSIAFGGHFTQAFVPPYHGYDDRTLQVLGEEKFKIFSAGTPRNGNKKHLLEIPALVSYSQYKQEKKTMYEARDVIENIARIHSRRSLAGVLIHHADFVTKAACRDLTKFLNFIAKMKNEGKWKVLLFSDLERKVSI